MPLSDKITQNISKEIELDQDKYEIINYGAKVLIQFIISSFFIAVFGLLTGVLVEAFIVTFTSSILRQASGGIHASRPSICIFVGTVVAIGLALLSKLLANYSVNSDIILYIYAFITVILFAFSFYTIYNKVPVDSKAKPINSEKKKKRMKRNSYVIVTFYLVIMLILTIAFIVKPNVNILTYLLCICGGLAFQVFTLTIAGHFLLGNFDRVVNSILFSKGGE